MTEYPQFLPPSGPTSDPVLYGVAQALAHLFPPVDALPDGKEDIETGTTQDIAQDSAV